MSLRTRVATPLAAVATVAVLTLAACASTLTGTGYGSGAPAPPPSSAASSTQPATTAAPTVAPVTGAATPCPHSRPKETFACLQGVLSNYWSGQLNHVVSERIVVDARPAEAPPACRPGIEAGAAITCKDDLTLYISHRFLAQIESHFSGLDRALAFASVASHEFGHVLQYTLRQPQIEQRRPSDSTSQFVEQQADCLSGVWAGSAAAQNNLDANEFIDDAEKLIELVSTNPEIETHGTPLTRRAAIERGIAGSTAGVCNLVTFH